MNDIDKVLNSKVNEEMFLDNSFIYKVKFEIETLLTEPKYKNGTYYSWTAYSQSQKWRCFFPMKDTNYVKFFKTLNGAKRNFIRTYLSKERNY